jgi:biofilm PGA synthesis N-glycosyltransferase PgaC
MINIETTALVVLIVFAVSALLQYVFYFFIYMKLAFFKIKESQVSETVPVSIIICAKNEEENLENYLTLVLEQEYPDYEVVVVNDCSIDGTEDVLKRLMLKYSHLRTTFIKEDEKFSHGKKLALTVGIKSAKNEWLLLTDADCYPESKQWLASMASNFKPNTDIVLGYGGYSEKPGFLNMLIRFDTATIAINYLSFALVGRPYMGIGRNLAYRKSMFFNNKGFASHARLNSGDDDLFINEVATATNVKIQPSVISHTRSKPKTTFEKWVDQKARHFTTFSRYKTSHKIILGAEVFSRLFFILSFIALLIMQDYWIAAVSVFFVRIVGQLIVYKKSFKLLNERNLFVISPLFDLIVPFIHFGIHMSNTFRTKKQWR